ncbi:hypothetical protein Agabi119p4_3870 [Agaricus bisporus var. burnettii]|uniref:Uncharacterized protein n=1 Tax=Agaricus bisporus var. burnettii TaxID=192524 RepID=A0A8H7F5H8_AGABI|nr:hypothetical protein Agabi119p4_3870 [Agaricus bisporus var. burnettii]
MAKVFSDSTFIHSFSILRTVNPELYFSLEVYPPNAQPALCDRNSRCERQASIEVFGPRDLAANSYNTAYYRRERRSLALVVYSAHGLDFPSWWSISIFTSRCRKVDQI